MISKKSSISSINELFTWIAQNIQITLAATDMKQGISIVHIYFLTLPAKSLQLNFAEEW